MSRMVRVVVLAGALLAAGAGGSASGAELLEPLVLGGERFFAVEWEAAERRGRPVVYGTIGNEWGFPARRVQLLVESLDGSGRVLGQRVTWLGGELMPGTRAWFEARVPVAAPAYRVRVFAWDWIQAASADMP